MAQVIHLYQIRLETEPEYVEEVLKHYCQMRGNSFEQLSPPESCLRLPPSTPV